MKVREETELPKVVLWVEGERFFQQIHYAFDLLMKLSLLRCDYLIHRLHDDLPRDKYDLHIVYGHRFPQIKAPKAIHIVSSKFFSDAFLERKSLPNLPIKRYKGIPILYCGADCSEAPYVEHREAQIRTNMDIVASAFFLATRYEEVLTGDLNVLGRVPFTATLACNEGFWDRPVVNEYAALLGAWMQSLIPEKSAGASISLWEGRRAAVCLTHDVDYYRKAKPLLMAAKLLSEFFRHGNMRRGSMHLLDFVKTILRMKRDSYLTIDDLREMEKGFRTTYYFLSARTTRWYRNYGLKKEVGEQIMGLNKEGAEIGLHATLYAFDNSRIMYRERESLETAVRVKTHGVRNHELRWDPRKSWQIQDRAGFLYDSTLTFAEKGGFRCGVCHPFQPFDLMNNRRLEIWEVPLTMMDVTLRDPKYLSMSPEQSYEELIRYLHVVEEFKGIFVLLWHNTSFDEVEWKGWRWIYEKFLRYLRERDYLVDHCRNLLGVYCNSIGLSAKRGDRN
jgi:hypothetical protein